jgi:abnormal spindle-like microcephaly-associated protein
MFLVDFECALYYKCFWGWFVAGASSLRAVISSDCLLRSTRGCFKSIELEIFLCSVLKLQRWWKGVLLLKLRTKSAVVIQSHIRAWLVRRNAAREKHGSLLLLKLRTKSAVIIQSHIRGWLDRRNAASEKHRIIVIQVI